MFGLHRYDNLEEPIGTCKMAFHKQRFFLRIAIATLLHLCAFICGDNCNSKITRPALTGFRCVTKVYHNFTGIQAHTCTYLCITRKECTIVNYNIQQNVCHLSNGPCIVLEADDAFQVKYLGLVYRSDCFRWRTSSTFADSEMISSPNCHPTENICYLGRLVSSSNVLPGKYLHASGKVWTVFDGNEVNSVDGSSTKEILDVRPGCQLTWMPFSTGDPIPVGAVEGGLLANNGAILYVMRGPAETYTGIFGYYDPKTPLGILPHKGTVTVTEMELLVVLWSLFNWTWRIDLCSA